MQDRNKQVKDENFKFSCISKKKKIQSAFPENLHVTSGKNLFTSVFSCTTKFDMWNISLNAYSSSRDFGLAQNGLCLYFIERKECLSFLLWGWLRYESSIYLSLNLFCPVVSCGQEERWTLLKLEGITLLILSVSQHT